MSDLNSGGSSRPLPCPHTPCCSPQEFTELSRRVNQSSQVKNTFFKFFFYLEPPRYPPGEKGEARTRPASQQRISSLFLLLYQFVHRTPWLEESNSALRQVRVSHWEIALKKNALCLLSLVVVRSRRNFTPQKTPSAPKMALRKINPALWGVLLQSYKTVTVYGTRGGCIVRKDVAFKICLRLLFPWKVHFCLQTWIDVLVANSCSD